MADTYQLGFSLDGHASDVRSIAAPAEGVPLLLSGSRDGSAIVWGPSRDGMWEVKLRVQGPEKRFVSCVGMTKFNGSAFLLVGSSTGVLSTFPLPSIDAPTPEDNPEPTHLLVEHRQNLCCLDVSKGGLVATGSWDKSVLIWIDFKVQVKIEKHQQAVWAVKFVGQDKLLTAGADNKILLHSIDLASKQSTVLQEYTGHTQPVRGLSLRPDGKGFWSAANDGLVNIYDFDKSQPVASLSGHSSFVYSVTALPDGSGAVSSGEDGTLRVWSNTGLVQTIPHPCSSLWSSAVVSAPNGSVYIASSAQDGQIRLFTKDPTLVAPPTERERWDAEVSSRQLDKSQVGDVKHSDLPGIEALGREGKKDGQVIMIKNEGKVEAYSWVSSAKTWQQVGTVVDAIGQDRKQLFDGKEYDYVFDVDIADGVPPLKLPYNVSENPWIAAQKFLEKNELPHSYVEQVVNFIEKNTQGQTLGQESSSYVDPYTGASRYTGSSSASAAPSAGGGDPFTGAGAYRSTPAAPVAPTAAPTILPVKRYLSFKAINIIAAKGKIAQLNEELKTSNPSSAFTPEDDKNLAEIYSLLSLPVASLSSVKGEEYAPEALFQLILRWPEAQRFPLIDLARALASFSPALATPSTPELFLATAEWDATWSATKPRETNTLLALRGIANLFSTSAGRQVLTRSAGTLLQKLTSGRSWSQLGARKLPLVTIALNFSVLAANGEFPSDQAGALLDLVNFVLENETTDSEVLYRASVALGNVLVSPATSGGLQVGDVITARSRAIERASSLGEKRLVDLAQELGNLGA